MKQVIESGSIENNTSSNQILKVYQGDKYIDTNSPGEIVNQFDSIKSVNISEFNIPAKNELTKSEEDTFLGEGTVIKGWKLVEEYSAKILDFDDKIVYLDCLIDKSNSIYEEREFNLVNFEGIEIKIGNLLKLSVYSRPKQVMLQILDNPGIVNPDDFPNTDFTALFGNINFSSKK